MQQPDFPVYDATPTYWLTAIGLAILFAVYIIAKRRKNKD